MAIRGRLFTRATIWIAAVLSNTDLGVRPGARDPQPLFQRDLQALGEEGNKDVRLDPLVGLVVDRADHQVSLQFLERLSTSTSCR